MSISSSVHIPKKNVELKIFDKKTHCPKSDCHHQGVYYLGTDFITMPPRVEAVHYYSCSQDTCRHTWTRLAN